MTIASTMPDQVEIVDDETIFIGNNAKTYKEKWAKIRDKKNKISFNWAALLFGPFWAAYRKMYMVTSVWLGLMLLLSALEIFGVFSIPGAGPFIAVAIMFSLYADGIYMERAHKQIARIAQNPDSAEREASLRAAGGTSPVAVVLSLAGYFAASFILALFSQG